VEAGSEHRIGDATRAALEAEVAVMLQQDIDPAATLEGISRSVAAWAPAIEVVDFDRPLEDIETILREGVFHRAVVLGQWQTPAPGADLCAVRARVEFAGEAICDVNAREATGDVAEVLSHLAKLLEPHGERLAAQDVVILGSMNPPTFARPDTTFTLDLSGIGRVSLELVD
jgi:2-keto-4-pentenoate hydratase